MTLTRIDLIKEREKLSLLKLWKRKCNQFVLALSFQHLNMHMSIGVSNLAHRCEQTDAIENITDAIEHIIKCLF